jgi:uncharacterized protein (TIGR00661 family)
MSTIIYGVSGEGSGHSTRARVVASHLLAQGHKVWLASYDRGYRNLSTTFEVLEIDGLTIGSRDNRVSLRKTIAENMGRLPSAGQRLGELRELFKQVQPDVVITDFEPMTAYLAHHYGLPLISLDNQQRMRYVISPIPPGYEGDARWTRAIIRAMIPKPDVCLITTFVQGKPKHDRVFQFPPIVSPDVVARLSSVSSKPDAPVLVYVTCGFESLVERLSDLPHQTFVVYGCAPDSVSGHNIIFKAPSREGFLEDLVKCRAVMATAGFTLISESLFLKKPYLAFPMQGQYEQQLNAFQLQQSGLGRLGDIGDRQQIKTFLSDLELMRGNLEMTSTGDNRQLLDKLDSLVSNQAAAARAMRGKRKGQDLGEEVKQL